MMFKWMKRTFGLTVIFVLTIMIAMISFVSIKNESPHNSSAIVNASFIKVNNHKLLKSKKKISHHNSGKPVVKKEIVKKVSMPSPSANFLAPAPSSFKEFLPIINPIKPSPTISFANKQNVKLLMDFLNLGIIKVSHGDNKWIKLMRDFIHIPYGKLISYFDILKGGPITDVLNNPETSLFSERLAASNIKNIFKIYNNNFVRKIDASNKTKIGVHMKFPAAGVDVMKSLEEWFIAHPTPGSTPMESDIKNSILPSTYEFEAAKINAASLKTGSVSFIYKYMNSVTHKTVESELFMNFDDGILADKAQTLSDAYKNKDIFFRTLDKTAIFDPASPHPNFLGRITFAQNGIKLVKNKVTGKISIYVTIKKPADEAWISMNPNAQDAISSKIDMGFLDDSMSPLHYGKTETTIIPAATIPANILDSIREFHVKSRWNVESQHKWSEGTPFDADHLQLYMRKGEEITFNLAYRGINDKSVFADGPQSIKIKAIDTGVEMTPKDSAIQIEDSNFHAGDHAFEIKYRTLKSSVTDFGSWYKVDIYAAHNIFQLGAFSEPSTDKFKPNNYILKGKSRSHDLFFTDPTTEKIDDINKKFDPTSKTLHKELSKHVDKDNLSSRILASLYGSWSSAISETVPGSGAANANYTSPVEIGKIFAAYGKNGFKYNEYSWDNKEGKLVKGQADASIWTDSKTEVETLIKYSNSLITILEEKYHITINRNTDKHRIDYLRPEGSKLISFVSTTLKRILDPKDYTKILNEIKKNIDIALREKSNVFDVVKERVKPLFAAALLQAFEIENKWFKAISDNIRSNIYRSFLTHTGSYKTLNIDSIKSFHFSGDESGGTDLFNLDESHISKNVTTGTQLIMPLFEYVAKTHLDEKILTNPGYLEIFKKMMTDGTIVDPDTYQVQANVEYNSRRIKIIEKIIAFIGGEETVRPDDSVFGNLLSGKTKPLSLTETINDRIAIHIESIIREKMFSNDQNIEYKWLTLSANSSKIQNEIVGSSLLSLFKYIKKVKYNTLSDKNKNALDKIINGNIRQPSYIAGVSIKIGEYHLQRFINEFSNSQPNTQAYAHKIVDSDLSKVLLIDISGPKKTLNWLAKNSGKVIKYAMFATFGLMALSGLALLMASMSKKMIVAKSVTLRSIGIKILIVGIVAVAVAVGILPVIEPHEGATLL